jgi:hypothetical protein
MVVALKNRGHRVTVVPFEDRSQTPDRRRQDAGTWDRIRGEGIEVRPMAYNRPVGFLRLRGLLKRGGFDVVHVHRDQALIAAWRATWGLRGAPGIVAQRGTTRTPPDDRKAAFRSPRVSGFVAVAEAVKTSLVDNVGIVPEKIHVIYGSVDLREFAPRPPLNELREIAGIRPTP